MVPPSSLTPSRSSSRLFSMWWTGRGPDMRSDRALALLSLADVDALNTRCVSKEKRRGGAPPPPSPPPPPLPPSARLPVVVVAAAPPSFVSDMDEKERRGTPPPLPGEEGACSKVAERRADFEGEVGRGMGKADDFSSVLFTVCSARDMRDLDVSVHSSGCVPFARRRASLLPVIGSLSLCDCSFRLDVERSISSPFSSPIPGFSSWPRPR
mmetsp:Transcript_18768/g.47564  ORF Transcript_18768/g.47564 Transcript_18768/m.47564 type:complete len:211 (-) Transcript_18768:554-1186(-)